MIVHNHPPYRPVCNERVVDGELRGACIAADVPKTATEAVSDATCSACRVAHDGITWHSLGMLCARCGQHAGNNHQGHYWGLCKVLLGQGVQWKDAIRDLHFCCPDDCELESGAPGESRGDQGMTAPLDALLRLHGPVETTLDVVIDDRGEREPGPSEEIAARATRCMTCHGYPPHPCATYETAQRLQSAGANDVGGLETTLADDMAAEATAHPSATSSRRGSSDSASVATGRGRGPAWEDPPSRSPIPPDEWRP